MDTFYCVCGKSTHDVGKNSSWNEGLLALKCTQGFWLSKIFELSKQSKVHTRQFGLPENEEKFLRWVR